MKIKITEPQRKALKALALKLTATYVDCGRFSHAYWNRRDRPQCTSTMKALKAKCLVEFVKRDGASVDHDIVLTDAGREAIGAATGETKAT